MVWHDSTGRLDSLPVTGFAVLEREQVAEAAHTAIPLS
jgi:hypothetical protein